MNSKYTCLLLILTVLLLTACPGSGIKELRPKDEKGVVDGVDWSKAYSAWKIPNDKDPQTTPQGAKVLSMNNLSQDKLNQIDSGLNRAIENAKKSGWTKDNRPYYPSFYQVIIPLNPCGVAPESKLPAFALNSPNYDGTIYDQVNTKGEETDPVLISQGYKYKKDGIGGIYAPEAVGNLGLPDSGGPATFYLCEIFPDFAEVSNNAAEHIIAANEDPDYYLLTETHNVIGHPFLPKQTKPAGLLHRQSGNDEFPPNVKTQMIKDKIYRLIK